MPSGTNRADGAVDTDGEGLRNHLVGTKGLEVTTAAGGPEIVGASGAGEAGAGEAGKGEAGVEETRAGGR